MKNIVRYYIFFLILGSIASQSVIAQQNKTFNRQDTLRGSITAERAWWDVMKYDLFVQPDYASKKISGQITITYKVLSDSKSRMQIDLQQPMQIDRVVRRNGTSARSGNSNAGTKNNSLNFTRDGNVYYIEDAPRRNKIDSITIHFSGTPRAAINPPWDGGWIFSKDAQGRPWMTVACQGLGASVWFPCKDHQSDEPDEGALIRIKVPADLVAVANGRLVSKIMSANDQVWTWQVRNPINNYNIVPYIGKYVHWSDSFIGENKKELTLDYWVLDYNLEKAKNQFGRDVKPMLTCFEEWMGPYPFYEDGFKLVESPHLGMEHQSAIAYGNRYMDGYLGMDLSGSGWGKEWDYIIIHESGHEWFANNITTRDIADMWIHEGFTDYSEVLFVECQYGRKAADEYCQGLRKNIENDIPIIGSYHVNNRGSGDMYAKGANLIHTIRQMINDDVLFRNILRGLNKTFFHKTIDSKDVEDYISRKTGKNLTKVFDQFLRTTMIPELEYKMNGQTLSFRWSNTIDGFDMPLRLGSGKSFVIEPTTAWKQIELPLNYSMEQLSPNYYITTKMVK